MKTKKMLLAASLMLCVSGQVMAQDESGFDVSARDLLVPNRLAATGSLRYADGEYHLTLDDTERQVARYNVRGVPAVPEEKLEEVLKSGYFSVGGSEVEPTLEWKGRVVGGMRRSGPAVAFVGSLLTGEKDVMRNSIAAAAVGGAVAGLPGAIVGFIIG